MEAEPEGWQMATSVLVTLEESVPAGGSRAGTPLLGLPGTPRVEIAQENRSQGKTQGNEGQGSAILRRREVFTSQSASKNRGC